MTFWLALSPEISSPSSKISPPIDRWIYVILLDGTLIIYHLGSDWFRIQTLEDSIQPTVDLILNMAIFMWLGAVCPWSSFTDGSIIPAHRLLLLGISVLLFRRLPAIYLLRRFIPQISNRRLAFFTGFFGPIGISAIFYCCIAADFLRPFIDEHPELGLLEAKLQVVVWYLVMSSIVSLPLISSLQVLD